MNLKQFRPIAGQRDGRFEREESPETGKLILNNGAKFTLQMALRTQSARRIASAAGAFR